MEKIGNIVKVAGPLVVAQNMSSTKMYDVVFVSEKRLMGEIVEINGDLASIPVSYTHLRAFNKLLFN